MTKEATPQPEQTPDLQPTEDQYPRVPSNHEMLVLEYQALPHEYRDAAEWSYKGHEMITDDAISEAINEGHLSEDHIPEDHFLPCYPEFLQQIVTLAPTFKSMAEQGQQPQVIFNRETVDPTSPKADVSPWSVKIIGAVPSKETS